MTIPSTMQAAILVELKKPLVIDTVELPQSLEAGQVLVRIAYSGICGSQLGEIDGAKGEDKFLPHLLGHEGSGTVVAIGPGVRHVAAGDKVVLHWRKGMGIESVPPRYTWRNKQLNAGWVTTFNQYAIVAENRVTRIAPDINMRIACLFGCAITTGFGVVVNNAKLKIGESLVVYGAGGIGLNIVQAASLTSAWPIIAVDLYDEKLALAQKMGATHLINAAKTDPETEIKRILGTAGPDVFVDNTGLPRIIELGYAITKPQGRVVLVGVPKAGQSSTLFTLPIHFGKTLVGSHGGDAVPNEDIPRYLKLFGATTNPLDQLITHEVDLPQINDAIAGIRDGSIAGRCVVKMDGEA
ncbi:zinc-binding dehydrogenase (plasmid) [Azospirillum sp. A26]|uniref:zinc-binding dehydrogenase n=1 Tax=Azospirillum sp. A26 TaxID=3160607 RepID=UPI00366D915C